MKKILQMVLVLLFSFSAQLLVKDETIQLPENCKAPILNMTQCPLAEDVTMDDASDSMHGYLHGISSSQSLLIRRLVVITEFNQACHLYI